MLTRDTKVFVETIEVAAQAKGADKRRRRAMRAQLEVLQATLELRLAEQVLKDMERDLVREPSSSSQRRRRLLRRGRTATTERDVKALHGRLARMREELGASRARARVLEQQAHDDSAQRPMTRVYRLHSPHHHVTYSEREYARLSTSQLATPMLVAKSNGMWWWWYHDRFWWDDEGRSAADAQRGRSRSGRRGDAARPDEQEHASFSGRRDPRPEGGSRPAPRAATSARAHPQANEDEQALEEPVRTTDIPEPSWRSGQVAEGGAPLRR